MITYWLCGSYKDSGTGVSFELNLVQIDVIELDTGEVACLGPKPGLSRFSVLPPANPSPSCISRRMMSGKNFYIVRVQVLPLTSFRLFIPLDRSRFGGRHHYGVVPL